MTDSLPTSGETDPQLGARSEGQPVAPNPMKAFRGIAAGTLVLESITCGLVLTVIGRVNDGAYYTPGRMTYVTALTVLLFAAAFVQRRSWGLAFALALQMAMVAGFFVHPSMGIMGIIFALVWVYLLVLRRNLVRLLAKRKSAVS